jgi:hypothetical protein
VRGRYSERIVWRDPVPGGAGAVKCRDCPFTDPTPDPLSPDSDDVARVPRQILTVGPRGTRQYHASQQAFVTAGEDLLAPPFTACGQIVGKRNRALISPLRYRLRTQTWTSTRDSERLHGYKRTLGE